MRWDHRYKYGRPHPFGKAKDKVKDCECVYNFTCGACLQEAALRDLTARVLEKFTTRREAKPTEHDYHGA